MSDRFRLSAPVLAGLLLFHFASLWAKPVASQSGEASLEPASERWVPGLAITSLGLFQHRDASIESVERGRFEGDEVAAIWTMGIQPEIATPELALPGRPRIFVRGGLSFAFDSDEAVASDGDPGTPMVPTRVGGGGSPPVAGVTNRGSAVRAKALPLTATAGFGFVFETEIGTRSLRIRPSLEWQWQEDEVTSLFAEAESEGGNATLCVPSCRTVSIDSNRKESFHSIGPGIELEVDAGRFRSFEVALFTSFQALAILGDREVDFRDTGTWMTSGGAPARADSIVTGTYSRDRWHYRAGVGLRFHWLPE